MGRQNVINCPHFVLLFFWEKWCRHFFIFRSRSIEKTSISLYIPENSAECLVCVFILPQHTFRWIKIYWRALKMFWHTLLSIDQASARRQVKIKVEKSKSKINSKSNIVPLSSFYHEVQDFFITSFNKQCL